MKDLSRNQRIQILIRPQGINKHVGIELETENFNNLNELLLEANMFIEDNSRFLEERYGDDENSDENN